MLILIAIVLGLLIGIIRKGSFKGLSARRISLLPIGIIGGILQLFLHFYMYTGGIGLIDPYIEIVNFASYILVLVMLVFNLDDFWVILMALGITANFVVIFINGGHMPVSEAVMGLLPTDFAQQITDGINPIFTVTQETTLLGFLGVIIPLPIPFLPQIMSLYGAVAGISPGSIVALLGLSGYIQYMMMKKGSIISDKNMDYLDDEGIFGDDEGAFEGRVSLNEREDDQYDEDEEFSMELDGTGAIHGDIQEDDYRFEADDEIEAYPESYDMNLEKGNSNSAETRVIPASVDATQRLEIGTETEEILVVDMDNDEFAAATKVLEPIEDGSTKVLGNIQEAGTFVKKTRSREMNTEDMEEILNSDEAGFFEKKYYEEKLAMEKERLELEARERELSRVAQSMLDANVPPRDIPETDLRIVESLRLSDQEQPFVLRSEKNPYQTKKFSEHYEDEEEFSEGEMLSVWQRLNQEDEKKKAQRRKQVIRQSNIDSETYLKPSIGDDEGISFKEIEDATKFSIKKAFDDENGEDDITQPEEIDQADETAVERKRAGYELVKLQLDGKEVEFWRKKKEGETQE
ncbi:DUF5317 domain-containing protein [Eubacteriaceae bacterium ES3]|nr:DUF5317 domain-containing protein [Eubacteriaceae bacterium ES3]